ncbi:MAG: glutamine--fructose-6-phosphate transaminase (isomerizing) [Candidatus Harrisonbacteria bacterium]|nr:glutamine--fructose-6-phosphate transaminase (isomerizing) [Candidatus Harrisonbacteria bacterium]
MCGIVGYVGKQKAAPILLDGIKTLEYRGYDSAGMATLAVESGKWEVESAKATGRVFNLENKLKSRDLSGNLGIVHSRWATHGGVTEANAHPHTDCQKNIWLVHNGIIENYKELKNELAASGHKFLSETDTEVLTHLIEGIMNNESGIKDLESAVRLALKKVKGTYGLAIIDRREPEKLVAVRNFSPLLLGVGKGEYIVASDASAVIRHTRKIIYLNDGEMAVLTAGQHRISNLDNQTIARDPEELEWTMEDAQKGGYPHFMLKEIFEQPEALENSLRGRLIPGEGLAKLGGLEIIKKELRNVERIHIAACGTAYYAGKVGEYMLEEYAGIPTEVDIASEFRYRKPVFGKNDLMLVISQSGETADTLGALREAKEKGLLTAGIVNVVGSTLARETDAGVYQHIGPEIGVASTKAFTSQVAILALFTLFLGRQRAMSLVVGNRIAEELQKLPDLAREVLKNNDLIKDIAKKYKKYNNFFYLGRKYNMPTALEGSLKLKEVSYVHAEGYGAGEMKHGPIAMIDENFPSIVIVTKDSVYEKMISNIQEIKARRGPVIAIATEGDKEVTSLVDDVIYIPKTLEMLTPVLATIPLQLFAYHFGVLRGHDVDKPRNLAKSVTVE